MIYKQQQIESYIKRPDSNIKAILLYGQNEGLIAEYTKKLTETVSKDLYDPFAVAYLDWSEIRGDVGALAAEYNSRSLMGVRRVVVLKDADNNLTKPLTEMLADTKSDTLLIICGAESINSKSSLVALANGKADMAAVACYEDRDENIASSAKKMLLDQGITFTNDAFMMLCARLSNDRKSNVNEIEKLITFVGNKKHFEVDDVKAVVVDQAISGVDDLCFYVFSGVKLKAVNSLKYLLNEGVEEVQIARALIKHVGRLLEAKGLMESGTPAAEAIKKVLPKNMFYRYDMGANQLGRWPKERLFDVMELLYKTEKDCKTTNMPAADALSYSVLTLLSAANKLAR